jgi:hypothetical protein
VAAEVRIIIAGENAAAGALIEAKTALEGVGAAAVEAGGKTSSFFSSMLATGGGLLVAEAFTKIKDSIVDFATEGVAELRTVAGETGKMSREMGVSAESASALIAVFARFGVEMPEASTALGIFSKHLHGIDEIQGEGAVKGKGFALVMHDLGVSFQDASGAALPMDQVLLSVADKFKEMPNGVEKTGLAMQLFGRAGKDMIPILNQGSEGIKELESEAAKLGLVLTGDNVLAVKQYGMAQKEMGEAMAGVKLQIGLALMPILTELAHFLRDTAMPAFEKFIGFLRDTAGPAIRDGLGVAFKDLGLVLAVIVPPLVAAGEVIANNFTPAVIALSGATAVYALVQLPALIAAIPELIAGVGAATVAFGAQAVAVAAAVLPYALLVAAIYGVVKAYQDFQSQVENVARKVENSNKAWVEGTRLLDDYAKNTGFVDRGTRDLASNLTALRTQQDQNIQRLAVMAALGQENTKTYADLRSQINLTGGFITTMTGQLGNQVEALKHLHDTDAIETLRSLRGANAEIPPAVALSDEALKKLHDTLQKLGTDGRTAYQQLIDTQVHFAETTESNMATHVAKIQALDDAWHAATTAKERAAIEEKVAAENAGFAQVEGAAAASYAKQEAAQKAHLGQMLIAYITAKEQENSAFRAHGDELIGAIGKEYGVQESASSRHFGAMLNDIDNFATKGGGSAEEMARHLSVVGETASVMEQKLKDAVAQDYIVKLTEDLAAHRINAEQFQEALNHIDRYVEVQVHTIFDEEHRMSEHAGRQHGGPVFAGMPYTVGEAGRETFVPWANGMIVPNPRTIRSDAAADGGGAATVHISVDDRGSEWLRKLIRVEVDGMVYDHTSRADLRARGGG